MKRSYYSIILVLLLLVTALLNYLDRSTLSIANTEIATVFNLNPAQMGFLLSAFMWPYALASLPAGYLVDRFGINRIMVISIIAWSIACILGGLVIGFYSILFTRIFLGIAEAPLFIVATKLIQQNFPVSKRGFVSSIVALGPRLANILSPLILVGLILLIGWRGMFILLGVIGIALTIIWSKLQKHSPYKANSTSALQNTKLTQVLKDNNVIFLCIGNLCSSYAYWLFLTWLPYYFIEIRHLSLSQMSIATSISFVSAIISVMLGGLISDYLIKKGFTAISSRLVPIIGSCLIAGIAIILIPALENIFVIVITIGVTIFCLSLRVSPTWALVADISPNHLVGTIGGTQNFANFIGAGLAPLVTGFILSATNNNFSLVFIISSIICLLGSFSYMLISSKRTTLN